MIENGRPAAVFFTRKAYLLVGSFKAYFQIHARVRIGSSRSPDELSLATVNLTAATYSVNEYENDPLRKC